MALYYGDKKVCARSVLDVAETAKEVLPEIHYYPSNKTTQIIPAGTYLTGDQVIEKVNTHMLTMTATDYLQIQVTDAENSFWNMVQVYPTPTQSKTIVATEEQQRVTPDLGYHLSEVIVEPAVKSKGELSDIEVDHNGLVTVGVAKSGYLDIGEIKSLQLNSKGPMSIIPGDTPYSIPGKTWLTDSTVVMPVRADELVISPSKERQVFTPDENKYYNKVICEPGLIASSFGFNTMAIDEYTIDSNSREYTFKHSLGQEPVLAILKAEDYDDSGMNSQFYLCVAVNGYHAPYTYSTGNTGINFINHNRVDKLSVFDTFDVVFDADTIKFDGFSGNLYFLKGYKYTLTTFA